MSAEIPGPREPAAPPVEDYLDLKIDDESIPSIWRYDPSDPFAIEVAFPQEDGHETTWCFARDLARLGLHGPAGLGDVRFCPDEESGTLQMTLDSPEGRADLTVAAGGLTDFLTATANIVPYGHESGLQELAIDHAIQKLQKHNS